MWTYSSEGVVSSVSFHPLSVVHHSLGVDVTVDVLVVFSNQFGTWSSKTSKTYKVVIAARLYTNNTIHSVY